MRALVLSGGRGTRLYPVTYTQAKQLVPVANRPVLFRVLDAIVEAGITDIGIVVGDTAEEIETAVGDGSAWGAFVTYIKQESPLGLAHAVKISEQFLDGERFVMFLGDNVIEGGIRSLVDQFAAGDWNAQIVLKEVEDPRQFGVVELRNEQVIRLVEKPQSPPSNLALVGIYMFDRHIFEAVNAIEPSGRGELEITDAIQYLIDRGFTIHPYIHPGWWIDTGKMEDILIANRLILETITPNVDGFVDDQSTIEGWVVVERGAKIVKSVNCGPAIIGERTRVENSRIGPFTSIYHDCQISDCDIANAVVMEHCKIEVGWLEDSLVGRHVQIVPNAESGAVKVILADFTRVAIGQPK